MPRTVEGQLTAEGLRLAIVVSRFNGFITEHLVEGALDTLRRHGVADDDLEVIRVPGAFELGPVAKAAAERGDLDGILVLGAVIRGGTPHFDYVAGEAARAIGRLAMESGVAVSFGVLTCDTVEQAVDRAGVKAGNKGADAALALIEQIQVLRQLKRPATPRVRALRGGRGGEGKH